MVIGLLLFLGGGTGCWHIISIVQVHNLSKSDMNMGAALLNGE
jgi:hypothetical protein